jgi:methionyl aminopeptidase
MGGLAALNIIFSAFVTVTGFTSPPLHNVQQQQQHHHHENLQRRGAGAITTMHGQSESKKKAKGKGTKKAAAASSGGGFGKPAAAAAARKKSSSASSSTTAGALDVSVLDANWANAANFAFAGSVRPGRMAPGREVPASIIKPSYAADGVPKERGPRMPWQIEVKSPKDVEGMVVAGRVAREVLDAAGRAVVAGVTTDYLDEVVHGEIIKRGAYPSPLNYHNFPKSVCTSVNEVICHGIPDDSVLEAGDIVNVDVTVYFEGYHGDCSETFAVPHAKPAGESGEGGKEGGGVEDVLDAAGLELVQVTYDCWVAAMDFCEPGRPYKEIGAVIEDYVKPKGYTTVAQFCGHGIGSIFHTNPNILHYRNNEPNGVMAVGHTFTIEPMICEGTSSVLHWPDKWTATTADGRRSAQFEHTLLMTENGVVPLTGKIPGESPLYPWERGAPYTGRGSL